mgnify:CR=1
MVGGKWKIGAAIAVFLSLALL